MNQALVTDLPPVVSLGGRPLPLVGRARIYACGITPYDVTHLGHAATFIWVDTLARVLQAAGTEVILCRNVTDADDVLLAAASRAGAPYDRFAAIQQFYFDQDMAALGVRPPGVEPRSHAYVGQVIELVAGVLARGAGYERDGQVFFRGAAVPQAAGLDTATALRLAAEYGDQPGDSAKDDPFDAAIWRSSGPDAPAWASPWGPGHPGWHAECAAMALHTFGPTVDVQAGGGDLRFPHHAYQAALAQALTGVSPFARVALQTGVVTVGGAKMAKSTGNLVLVRELLASYPPGAIRLMVLDRSWGEDWDYQIGGLEKAAARLERLQAAAGQPAHSGPGTADAAVTAVRAALASDLDVPAALRIAEDSGGQAARVLGSLLGLW